MMSNVFVKSLMLASAICATSSIAVAQQWDAEVQAGRMRSALDAASTSVPTVAAGLNYRGLNSGIALFVGVPTSEGAPFWGSVSASRRVELLQRGGFVAGVDLSGNGYLMRERGQRVRNIPDVFGRPQTITEPGITGGAFAGQALPVIGYEATRWQLHARAGASHYTSRFGELDRNHTVIISDAQLTLTPSSSFALVPVVRRYAADNTQDMYAGISAIAGNDAGSVWGSVGTWPGRDTVGVSWGVGATLKV
ncbi:MAG TPA: hypothetical protein VGD49_00305, partial [Longimicrobiales bacterium]